MTRTGRSSPAAFTLVELLVVVGIIAVVAAMLLAGISRARMHAQRVACSSHLRQIGQALISYAMDHTGWLPASAYAEYRYDEDWVHWQPDRDVKRGSLMRYLGGDVNVLKCPAGVPDRKGYTVAGGRSFPPYPFSYSLNGLLAGIPYGGQYGTFNVEPCKLTVCAEPGSKVMAFEEDTTGINDGVWYAGSNEYLINRISSVSVFHDRGREFGGGPGVDAEYSIRGRGNVVFADGHCDFIERRKLSYPSYHNPRHRGGPY